jgi:hypothetical protein
VVCDVSQNRPAELVARFIDSKLRSGNKGTSEEELEEVLDRTMTLFRYIDGKVQLHACFACFVVCTALLTAVLLKMLRRTSSKHSTRRIFRSGCYWTSRRL